MTNYIAVLAHDEAANLDTCIEAIRDTVSHNMDIEIVVLGQALTATATKAIYDRYDSGDISGLYFSKQNQMAIGGRQRLFDMLRWRLHIKDVIIMLDDDVTPTLPAWDVLLADAARKYGIASQVAVNIRADWQDFEEPPDLETDKPGLYDVAGGGMTAYTDWLVLGLSPIEYDQSFLPFWHADADLSLQARSRGAQVWWTGDIGLKHDFRHKDHDFYWKRNFIKLRDKWQGKQVIQSERAIIVPQAEGGLDGTDNTEEGGSKSAC